MPASVPPHQAEVGVADSLFIALVQNLAGTVERDGHRDRRFVLLGLFQNRRGNRLVCHANPHFKRRNRFGENRVIVDPVPERTTGSAFQLITAIASRHAGVVRVFSVQLKQCDFRIFIRFPALQAKSGIHVVCASLHAGNQRETQSHAAHHRQKSAVPFFNAEDRQVIGVVTYLHVRTRPETRDTARPVLLVNRREQKIAVISFIGKKFIHVKFNPAAISRNLFFLQRKGMS